LLGFLLVTKKMILNGADKCYFVLQEFKFNVPTFEKKEAVISTESVEAEVTTTATRAETTTGAPVTTKVPESVKGIVKNWTFEQKPVSKNISSLKFTIGLDAEC
jgi:hypothetical protein